MAALLVWTVAVDGTYLVGLKNFKEVLVDVGL